jgi:hypothetical protein
MAPITRKIVVACAFVGIALALAVAISLRDSGDRVPNPNGYDDFVRAGKMVVWPLDSEGDSADYRELNLENLRVSAATNAEALRIVRGALEQRCRVPIQNSTDWFRTHLGEMITFKELTQVFLLTGRLALLEGQTNDAVNLYLDSIRFAHQTTRGGLTTETAMTRTQEALGMQGLKSIQESLDASQCRRIAVVLEELDAQQESWEGYFRRDLRYGLRAEPRSMFSLDHWRTMQRFKARFFQAQLQRRQAMLAFAVRAYELEHGTKLDSSSQLVPAYLKTFPQNPLTKKNLGLTP